MWLQKNLQLIEHPVYARFATIIQQPEPSLTEMRKLNQLIIEKSPNHLQYVHHYFKTLELAHKTIQTKLNLLLCGMELTLNILNTEKSHPSAIDWGHELGKTALSSIKILGPKDHRPFGLFSEIPSSITNEYEHEISEIAEKWQHMKIDFQESIAITTHIETIQTVLMLMLQGIIQTHNPENFR